jgi:hypothetical protein
MANPTGKGGFQPGQSGNPKGRPRKGRSLSDILTAAIRAKGDDGIPVRLKLMQKLIDMGLGADLDAIKVIFERVDGKVPDALNVNQQGGMTIRVVYIDSDPGPRDTEAASRTANGEDGGEEV